MRRLAIASAVGMCMMHASSARAGDTVAAEAAFAEARALMSRGNYAEACPKLEASYELDPAVGTLLNLGECLEKQGRTASAWLRFRQAAALAAQQNQASREQLARERARVLEPRLCHLVVRTDRKDLTILRDEIRIEPAAIALRVPVDPGEHRIEATAPSGSGRFARTLVIKPTNASCADTIVDVVLDDSAPAPPGVEPPKPEPPPPIPVVLRYEPPPSTWRTTHTLAIASAGAGVIAAGVGIVFAITASSTKSDADAACTSAGCTPHGHDLMIDAGRSADIATVTILAGATLLATGAVLWLVSPSLHAPATTALAF